ncbi:hypothetical protein C8R44DRAFT_885843 [Mycena epipterygia]|nr:hypothetical protein C8R44DRAFT_885843 [Mycena epipterygia]
MFSKILAFGLCSLALVSASTLKSGTYMIRNKATTDRLVAYRTADPILVSSTRDFPAPLGLWAAVSQGDSIVASEGLAGILSINAVADYTDEPLKFVITNVADHGVWAGSGSGKAQERPVNVERPNGNEMQQWEFKMFMFIDLP